MKNDKVSVLMSIFNESEDLIKSSINSILEQTYNNLELIIILDNPKNDSAADIIREYSITDDRIKFIINEKNIGLAKSLNKAFTFSTGKIIARMDADDISFNHRIESQIVKMEKNNLDFLSSRCEYIDTKGNVIREQKSYPNNEKFINKAIRYRNWFVHPTWIFKRKIFEDLGGYREFPALEDYDFIYRVIDRGYKVGVSNDILLKYRVNLNGMTMTKGLIQYKLSQYIINLHYQRKKTGSDNFNKSDINLIKQNSSDNYDFFMYQKQINYIREEKYYHKKLVISLRNIFKSKYFRQHFKDTFIFNLLCLKYGFFNK